MEIFNTHTSPYRSIHVMHSMNARHSNLPLALLRAAVVPIVKSKTGDASDKQNYRPISLATAAAKVLDYVHERRINGKLNLQNSNFGFRK